VSAYEDVSAYERCQQTATLTWLKLRHATELAECRKHFGGQVTLVIELHVLEEVLTQHQLPRCLPAVQ